MKAKTKPKAKPEAIPLPLPPDVAEKINEMFWSAVSFYDACPYCAALYMAAEFENLAELIVNNGQGCNDPIGPTEGNA
jgi:hypothetical protein